MIRLYLVLALVLGAACGGRSAPAPAAPAPGTPLSGLELVPADTPYLYVTFEPLVQVYDRLLASKAFQATWERVRAEAAARPRGERSVGDRILEASLDELRGDLSRVFEESGLGVDMRFVVYGLSIHPAVRVEVADSAKVRAWVEKVLRAGSAPFDVTKVSGHEILTFAFDDRVGVIAFPAPHEVVGGIFPADDAERYVRRLLGVDPPATSIVGTGRLRNLGDGRQPPDLAGFVDVRRVLQEIEIDEPCRGDAMLLASIAPSIELSGTFDANAMTGTLRVVVEPEVGELLAELPRAVPGLVVPPPGDPLVLLGVGVDLDVLDALVVRAARAIQRRPFRCPALAPLNTAADVAAAGILAHLPPELAALRGAQVTVDDVEVVDGRPARVAAHAVVLHDRPLDVLGELAAQLPALGTVVEGRPADLDVRVLGIPGVERATVLVRGSRIGIAAGEDFRADAALDAPAAQGTLPIAVIALDLKRWSRISRDDDMVKMAPFLDAFGRFAYELLADRRGLALRVSMELD